ncbi:MAG: hypothetical protein KAI79_12610 [Bacteroidales bacterium]|nr:hypothetical protein [Bacteroidales bacterium]
MNSTELKKSIYAIIDKLDNKETLNQFYSYLKSKSTKEITKLWERFYSVYSYKKVPEEGAQESPDFISQMGGRIKHYLK